MRANERINTSLYIFYATSNFGAVFSVIDVTRNFEYLSVFYRLDDIDFSSRESELPYNARIYSGEVIGCCMASTILSQVTFAYRQEA